MRGYKKSRSLEIDKAKWGLIFVAPFIIGISIFFVWPMIETVIYSFSNLTVGENGFEKEFVGAKNYLFFFTKDTYFLSDLASSVFSSIPKVLIIIAFSTIIALVLRASFPGRGIARAVFFFPVIIASGPVMDILENQVMNINASSDVTSTLLFRAPDLVEIFSNAGLPEPILKSITDIVNQVFDLTWKSGVQILLMLAAVNNIPKSFYEVAVMEGATAWEKFWKVTLPTVSPTMLVVVVYSFIDGFMDYGNKIMKLLTSYYTGNNYSYSATIGIIYCVCILLLIGFVYFILSKWIFYSAD